MGIFDLFKRKDTVCGMKEEKGRGIEKHGLWFCAENCLKQYEKGMKEHKHGGCCHG